jgi:hypothetical protein
VIGGAPGNRVGADVHSATIAGGGTVGLALLRLYNSVDSTGGTIGGGSSNQIQTNSADATIAGGYDNTILTSAPSAAVGGGAHNTVQASATGSTISGGGFNTIQPNGEYAAIAGETRAVARCYGQQAFAGGRFTADGDAQTSVYVLRAATEFTTGHVEMFLDGHSQRMAVPPNTTWVFDMLVVGRTTTGASNGVHLRGTIQNQNGSTTLVEDPVKESLALKFSGNVFVEADTAHDALVIKVTAGPVYSARWVAVVRTVEVTF